MKKLTLILFLISSSFYCQDKTYFTESDEYYLTEVDSLTKNRYQKEYPNFSLPISIFLKDKENKPLFELKIDEFEFYSGTTIEVLNTPNLKNTTQIIHLLSAYDACCTSYYSNYFLKTEEGKLIELPLVQYVHCDGPTPINEYRFPNQKFGEFDKILLTKSYLNKEYQVNSVEVEKTYTWNGESIIMNN